MTAEREAWRAAEDGLRGQLAVLTEREAALQRSHFALQVRAPT